jgi:hypothetical protein
MHASGAHDRPAVILAVDPTNELQLAVRPISAGQKLQEKRRFRRE